MGPFFQLGMTMLLAAGANQSFEPALPSLAFAASDAEQFAAAMHGVGMSPGDETMLKANPTRDELVVAFGKASVTFATDPGVGTQKFIFYFSGHADERGLHLKDGLLGKDELHAFLDKIPARTKVVILDSCYAGALATKGVRPVDGTLSPRLALDEPTGTIFLTAASARDVAIESSATQGSLFTHALIAGLYGAADANHDGVVTATELYEYAYRQTQLTSYMLPVGAPQKPELVSDLKGRGAVTLAMPAGKVGRLQLASGLAGRVAIQSLNGVASVEVIKSRGVASDVPLPAGAYRLWIKDGLKTGHAEVQVVATRIASVTPGEIEWRQDTSETLAMAKGPEPVLQEMTLANVGVSHHAHFSAFAGASPDGHGNAAEVSLTRDQGGDASGLMLTLGTRKGSRTEHVGLEHEDTWVRTDEERHAAFLGYQLQPLSASRRGMGVRLQVGAGFAVASLHRAKTDPGYSWQVYPMPGAASEVMRYPVGRIGMQISVLSDSVWVGAEHEGNLQPDARARAGSSWDTIGLGFTL